MLHWPDTFNGRPSAAEILVVQGSLAKCCARELGSKETEAPVSTRKLSLPICEMAKTVVNVVAEPIAASTGCAISLTAQATMSVTM